MTGRQPGRGGGYSGMKGSFRVGFGAVPASFAAFSDLAPDVGFAAGSPPGGAATTSAGGAGRVSSAPAFMASGLTLGFASSIAWTILGPSAAPYSRTEIAHRFSPAFTLTVFG